MFQLKRVWMLAAVLLTGIGAGYVVGAGDDVGGIPEAVRQAVSRYLPGARIVEAEPEAIGVRGYEVEVRGRAGEAELTVTADGMLVESERPVRADQLPAAVRKTLGRLKPGARIVEAERITVHAEVTVVPLDSPVSEYEVEVRTGDRIMEVRLAADGSVIRELEADDEDDEDDDNDHGDDDDHDHDHDDDDDDDDDHDRDDGDDE